VSGDGFLPVGCMVLGEQGAEHLGRCRQVRIDYAPDQRRAQWPGGSVEAMGKGNGGAGVIRAATERGWSDELLISVAASASRVRF